MIGYSDPAGHTTNFQHTLSGQLRVRTDAHGRRVELSYDNYGRLLALTNENGERYRFAWDAADRLTAQHSLDGSLKRYAYDPLDNVTRVEALAVPGSTDLDLSPQAPPSFMSWSAMRWGDWWRKSPQTGAPSTAMTRSTRSTRSPSPARPVKYKAWACVTTPWGN
nr:hypothetical protein GCM10020185_34730 [Pseudomonas brassicacearum subsp. brassicacearum]